MLIYNDLCNYEFLGVFMKNQLILERLLQYLKVPKSDHQIYRKFNECK